MRRFPAATRRFHDLAQRRARTNLLGRKPINLRVAAVAQDQPQFAVEKADALHDVVDGGPKALLLRLKRRDLSPKVAFDDFLQLARRAREGGQAALTGRLLSPPDWISTQTKLLRFGDQSKAESLA